jgi:hypothetical protein
MIRELNASIRALDDAEQLRRETESAIIRKKYVGGLGALGSWASGGMASNKSNEHAAAEAKARDVGIHRDGILWFLRQRLELCCRTQQDMMEARLTREMEKSRSMLSKSGASIAGDFAEFPPPSVRRQSQATPASGAIPTSDDGQAPSESQGLTEEQIQMFEEGNQDMMKHYESSLDKVRYVTFHAMCPSHTVDRLLGRLYSVPELRYALYMRQGAFDSRRPTSSTGK